jgi:acetyltransferase
VRRFLAGISKESGWNRLLSGRNLSPAEIHHLTRIDYEHEMAFIAVTAIGGEEREIGVARYVVDEDRSGAEFALLITDAWQHRGIGTLLTRALLRYAHASGLARMHGITHASNQAMIDLAGKLGFERIHVPSDATIVQVVKMLSADDPVLRP